MPFLSQKQSRWAFANKKKLKGKLDPEEWAAKTDYSKLPEQVKESQDYSLPADVPKAGSYEYLQGKMKDNMARHNSMVGNKPPTPGEVSSSAPKETSPPEKAFPVDSNVPKTTPSLPTDAMATPQVKAASVLASLLYLNKLK